MKSEKFVKLRKKMETSKQYLVAGIIVEAVKSEGGGFYDVTVIKTGDKQRYLADVFESVAKPLGQCKTHKTPHPKTDCKEWRHV